MSLVRCWPGGSLRSAAPGRPTKRRDSFIALCLVVQPSTTEQRECQCDPARDHAERAQAPVPETSCRHDDVQPTRVGIQHGERVVGYLLVWPDISADTDARVEAGLPSAVRRGDKERVTP